MYYALPDNDVVAYIDCEKTERMVMNLIGNAMKYANSHIHVSLDMMSEDKFKVVISDDGPGVPPEERDKIFDMYYQIGNDDVAATLGTGLGLAYAKLIVDAHQGALKLEDNVNTGATFVISMPIGEANSVSTLSPIGDDTEAVGDIETAAPDVKILLVEDNTDLRTMISGILSGYYSVETASDGLDAIDRIAQFNPDIIVSDVMMPRMNGFELCNKLKNDINYSHIPFIVSSPEKS